LANHIRLLLVAIVLRWKSAGWPSYHLPEYSSFILYKPTSHRDTIKETSYTIQRVGNFLASLHNHHY